jgi:magnesium chelatase subunit D
MTIDASQATHEPSRRPITYPFAAIVGQDQLRLALLLLAVDPGIGGLLARGEKGTAKSTAARGLAELLPPLQRRDCRFGCAPEEADGCPDCRAGRPHHLRETNTPFVTLPLGATEDRVIGSLDIGAAMETGRVAVQPGLLSACHRGVLYVDEVNLLDDHLADSLLACVESGRNHIQREGIGTWHRSRFAFVGTMNPEEGELRPQLLDRFALAVDVSGARDPDARVELLIRRRDFDANPRGFCAAWVDEQTGLRRSILGARERLPRVAIPRHLLAYIGEVCRSQRVAGHRADIALQRAAVAHAALHGRTLVSSEDISQIAPLVLLHRSRPGTPERLPPPPAPSNQQDDEREERRSDETAHPATDDPSRQDSDDPSSQASRTTTSDEASSSRSDPASPPPESRTGSDTPSQDQVLPALAPYPVRALLPTSDRRLRIGSGRRLRSRSATRQGRYVRATHRRTRDDLALDATLRAAAPHQRSRRQLAGAESPGPRFHIQTQDIREKVRERRVGSLLLFCVDASGSMGAQRRMVATKTAILSLLLDAYQRRDRVGLVIFGGREARTLLPPTSSVQTAARLLRELPVGGRTPLSAGLIELHRVLDRARHRDPLIRPLVLLLSDGRANAGIGRDAPHIEARRVAERLAQTHPEARFVVVDTEAPGTVRLGLAGDLAAALGAKLIRGDALRADALVAAARG